MKHETHGNKFVNKDCRATYVFPECRGASLIKMSRDFTPNVSFTQTSQNKSYNYYKNNFTIE